MFKPSLVVIVLGVQLFFSQYTFAQTKKPSVSKATTFHCVSSSDGYATVARRGTRQTPPMILWNRTLGDGRYTPQKRCEEVSSKFTQAVTTTESGRFGELLLTYGKPAGSESTVICYVKNIKGSCNKQNQLFTLKESDNPREILEQLVGFNIQGSGSPVQQSGQVFFANFGQSVDQFFDSSSPAIEK